MGEGGLSQADLWRSQWGYPASAGRLLPLHRQGQPQLTGPSGDQEAFGA